MLIKAYSKKDNIYTTGGPDVEYDYNNSLAVYKIMYENASKITRVLL